MGDVISRVGLEACRGKAVEYSCDGVQDNTLGAWKILETKRIRALLLASPVFELFGKGRPALEFRT